MMGRTHVLGGAALWLGGCAVAHPEPKVTVTGTVLAVVGSLAPDIDHRNAEAAQLARFAGAVLLLAGTLTIGLVAGQGDGPWLVVAGLAAASLPWALRPHRHGCFRGVVHSVWGLSAATVLAMVPALIWPAEWPLWAGTAVVAGWLSHLALDALTKEGLPLAWPARWRFGWPKAYAIRTGKRGGAEYWAVRRVLLLVIIVTSYVIVR